jgi:hypothetical protein
LYTIWRGKSLNREERKDAKKWLFSKINEKEQPAVFEAILGGFSRVEWEFQEERIHGTTGLFHETT